MPAPADGRPKEVTEALKCGKPHHARERRKIAGRLCSEFHGLTFHDLRRLDKPLTDGRQKIATRVSLKEFGRQRLLQSINPAQNRDMACPQLSGRCRKLTCPRNGQKILQVIPGKLAQLSLSDSVCAFSYRLCSKLLFVYAFVNATVLINCPSGGTDRAEAEGETA